jgi:phage gp36-like protein
MSYATLTEGKQRLGTQTTPPGLYEQLTDRLAATTANDLVGAEILAAAEAEVNGAIARRYKVPVDVSADAPLAAQLKAITLTLFEGIAWQTHPMRRKTPDTVRDAMNAARAWLKAVADGSMTLPGATAIAAATADGASATAVGHTRVFTEDAMAGL